MKVAECKTGMRVKRSTVQFGLDKGKEKAQGTICSEPYLNKSPQRKKRDAVYWVDVRWDDGRTEAYPLMRLKEVQCEHS